MQSPLATSTTINLVALCALIGCASAAAGCATAPARATRVDPAVQLQALNGSTSTFPAAGRGKVVVLDLWASWCQACRIELPKLQRLANSSAGDDLMVVAINVGEDRKTAQAYAAELKLSLPIYVDPSFRFARSVGARQFPSVIVLDRHGSIVLRARKLDAAVLRAIRKRMGRSEAAH